MVACDLEIVDINRAFQNLMLDFFNDDILTIDENQNVARTKLDSVSPALDGRIEGMGRRSNNLLAAYKDMDKLRGLVHIGFRDPAKHIIA